MKLKLLPTGVIAAVLLLMGCGDEAEKSESAAEGVFQVGEMLVTEEVLEHWISERSARGNVATAGQREALKAELVELLQLAELAKKRGLDETPEAVISKWRTMAQAARNDWEKGEVKDATDADLRGIFKTDARFATTPEKRKIAALWLPVDERKGMSLVKAREFYQQQRELFAKNLDAGFGSLSVDYSFHRPTRYKGGILGWMTEQALKGMIREEWQEEVVELAFGMKSGRVSEVVETVGGDELLVLVVNVEEGKTLNYEESLPRLKEIWKGREKERLEEELELLLSRSFPVKVN
jgi:hypothetical protein